MRPLLTFALLVVVGTAGGGCTRYGYFIAEPDGSVVPVGERLRVRQDPLQYVFFDLDEHLVVRVVNPTDDVVTLMGGRSFVVDPRGETHGLPWRSVAPRSHVTLVVPPIPPTVEVWSDPLWGYPRYGAVGPYRPYWGPGLRGPLWGRRFSRPWYYEPVPHLEMVSLTGPEHWEWRGAGRARIHLAYEAFDLSEEDPGPPGERLDGQRPPPDTRPMEMRPMDTQPMEMRPAEMRPADTRPTRGPSRGGRRFDHDFVILRRAL